MRKMFHLCYRSFVSILIILYLNACIHYHSKSTAVAFDMQGHRGCRSLMPENTIPAMIKALELVTTLEMDVVITKDKQVILSHEPFFNHEITTLPNGDTVPERQERSLNIYQMTYEETAKYDVGSKPHPRFPHQKKEKVHKPLLSDVIDSVEAACRIRQKVVNYNIETKTMPGSDNIYHPQPKEFVDLLMKVITEKGIKERVIIQSFDIRTLQYVHEKFREIRTALLIDEGEKRSLGEQLSNLGFQPAIYSPHFSLVTKELIKECHLQHILIIPWTVNDPEKIKELRLMNVDGIITDDPSLFNIR